MEGTNSQRAIRLFGHLLSHRNDILPYFTMGPFQKNMPLDLRLPWFSWGAIRYLDGFIKPGMKVFEWGSGGSTLFFADRQCDVYSVEDNPQWHQRMNDKAANAINNIVLQHIPYDFNKAENFLNSEYLNPDVELSNFDIIVVDGTEGAIKVRPQCFEKAQVSAKKKSIIIVDDSWRYPEIIEASSAIKIERFQGTGPCRPGVTTTDIHFY